MRDPRAAGAASAEVAKDAAKEEKELEEEDRVDDSLNLWGLPRVSIRNAFWKILNKLQTTSP